MWHRSTDLNWTFALYWSLPSRAFDTQTCLHLHVSQGKTDIKSHHNGWIFSVKTMENVNFIHHTDRTSPWEQFDPLKYTGYHTYHQVQHSKPSTMPAECISVLRTLRLVTTYTRHWLLPRVLYALHISPAGNVHNDTNHRPPHCGLLTSLLPHHLAPKQSPQYPAIQNSFNLRYSFHGRY